MRTAEEMNRMKKLLIIGVVVAAIGVLAGCASMKRCWWKVFPSDNTDTPPQTRMKWTPGHF